MTAHVMVHVCPQDLPPEGIQVLYRLGECFENAIEWDEIQSGRLLPIASANDLSEAGLIIDDDETPGFAGFEARTGTYWRYAHESDPDVFREYCMQIIEIQEPFSPRSSWGAWDAISESISKDRIRLSLKNRITGAELSYKVINKGFGYQIKDLSNGRRVQKMLKHDYILNQLLGTSFKKLNYQKIAVEAQPNDNGDEGGSLQVTFLAERLMLKYQINSLDFALGLFDLSSDEMELLRLVELPHSSVIEDTRSFLG
ncbi:hypothetical protein [Motiliproteus sediminis]|uniref:hypothetical protein n=1 Tax=Motiliproteus sediminis TaxID=1468178 RepID=UPI001AEFD306|nr:hypothetical protein [Motiliproteus sediminis]